MSATSSSSAPSTLPAGRWFPGNHTALEALLAGGDFRGRSAIFDWDNTCIHNDLGDAAFRWQLDRLQLALPPHVLAASWAAPIAALENAGFEAHRARALHHDACVAWARLWPAVVQNQQQAVRHSNCHLDFRAKLAALYDLLAHADGTVPEATAQVYALLAGLWGGLAVEAPAACVAAMLAAQNGGHPSEELWTPATAGEAGLQPYAFGQGLRPFAEVRELMAALGARGARVCVVSASFEPLVRALASAWAYPVQPGSVFGLRLARAETPEPLVPGALGRGMCPGYPITYRAGKVACIEQQALGTPVLVAGDALTDLEMLTHWPELQVRLLMHRPSAAPPMQALYREAGDPSPLRGPRTLLQGRNEVVGEFWPRQVSGPNVLR